jgi:hypothetical protein
MNSEVLKRILGGSDDEYDLWLLYVSIDNPSSPAQDTFYVAWEADTLTRSDGFEKLFEQDISLERYCAALVDLGMPQVSQIFDQVLKLAPQELRVPTREDELFRHLHDHFDELKAMAGEYYDASDSICSVAGDFIRKHREQFSL